MKASTIYFEAYSAALQKLPAESRELITRCDELRRRWCDARFHHPDEVEAQRLNEELRSAEELCDADSCADAVMQLRGLFTAAARKEGGMSARMNGQEIGLHVEEVQDPEVCWSEVNRACLRWLRKRGIALPEGVSGFARYVWHGRPTKRGSNSLMEIVENLQEGEE